MMGRNKLTRPKYKLTIGQRICCCCYPPFCATMSGARDDTDDLDDKLECISPTPSTHSYRSPSPPVSKQSAAAAARSSGVPTATPPKSAALKNNYETQEPPSLTAATATTDTNDYTNNLNDQYCIDTPLEWKSYNSPGSLTSRLSSSRHETPASSSITGSYLSSSIGTGTSHASTTSARTLGESDGPLPADVPSGLINMGNTCYMNATLQSLYSIESIRNQLLSSSSSSLAAGGDKVLTRELCNLFKQMKGSNGGGSTTSSYGQGKYGSTEVSPAAFKFEFARYQSKFSGFGQQDAQEFLRYLINGVHEESNLATKRTYRRSGASSGGSAPKTSQEAWSQYRDIVDDSPLVDLLVGQLCSTITCGQCQNKSHCWDPFWDLSLPLPMSRRSGTFSIRDVINEFTSAETLDSDERPSCAKCNKPTRSTKQISLARLPPVLILHLKKFTNDGYKLTNPDISIDKQLTFNGVNYKLKACISHHGMSSSSGHYTSLCEYSTRWYHFDDARVRDVTSKFDSTKLREAYVLFYTKSGSGATTSTTTTSRPTTPTTTTTTTTTAARRPSSSLVSSHSKL